jgi:hypothetical protein
VPQRIIHQGILLDGMGNPVTTPVSMRMSYYADSTSLTPVFAETLLVVPDAKGQFCASDGPFNSSVSNLEDAGFVGVGVGNDPEMTPRIKLGSAPFALFSESVIGDIRTSRGLFVMTSAAGDTTVKIDSAGNAHFKGDIKSGNSLVLKGNSYELVTSSGQMYFGREPGTFSDVKVGIGTHSPSATLHVEGTTYLNGVAKMASVGRLQSEVDGGARILGEQGNTKERPAIGFFSTNGVDDGGGGNGIYRPSANAMAFAVQSSEKLRISGWGVAVGAPPAVMSTPHVLHVNGPIATAVATVSGNVTLTPTHSIVLANNSGGAITLTLPAANTSVGRQYTVKKISANIDGVVNVQAGGTDTIDFGNYALAVQYEWVVLVSDGVNRWYTVGR